MGPREGPNPTTTDAATAGLCDNDALHAGKGDDMIFRYIPRRYIPRRYILVAGLAILVLGPLGAQDNPPAPGFDLEGSDPEAIALADAVMERMGGRAAWDATRFVTWNFFDRRRHFWDRHTGDIRVEGTDRETGSSYLVLMNLRTLAGRAWRDGVAASGDDLDQLLDLGESAWINDSYWLFMPYKLKDSGVTLRHLGAGQMEDGRAAQVLELTFRDVGRTPENKYHVYVADDSGLVEQWDFYAQAADAEPRFRIPWHDWRPFGSILLSADRGENDHTGVAVFAELPPSVFTSPEPVDLAGLGLAEPES